MRLTGKNQKEMHLLKHYTPTFLKDIEVTRADAEIYFDWSDRGKRRTEIESRIADENRTKNFTGLSALYFGKRYRDLAITSYIEDWGETLTADDFTDEPREIAEFVAKAIHKPGLLAYWKMFNAQEELNAADMDLLKPLACLGENL